MSKPATIIYCHCAYYDLVPDDAKSQVLDALSSSGLSFEAVADLCGLAARQDLVLKRWARDETIKIVACYPRTVKWLFHRAGAPLPDEGVEILNMRKMSSEEIISRLPEGDTNAEAQRDIDLDKKGDWVPWFPVIDYDRCVNCKQCLNFCLFGTYSDGPDGKVQVSNPAGCKTNCPACARVCPQAAIIFPKYADSPINGDEVDEEALKAEKAGVNLADVAGGDIRDAIRQRSKAVNRFSKDKPQHGQLSVNELQKKLDIPSEVLASMSPKDIARIKAKSNKDCPNSSYCNNDCDSESEKQDSE